MTNPWKTKAAFEGGSPSGRAVLIETRPHHMANYSAATPSVKTALKYVHLIGMQPHRHDTRSYALRTGCLITVLSFSGAVSRASLR